MRLLVLTQAVDLESTSLSFFHGWIDELSKRFDSLEVICLYEGRHSLPSNVRVHSLGKERRRSRLGYTLRFYTYLWSLRDEYDAALVHMNQEYVLLGGLPWTLMGKKIYMWRNHYAGSFLTRIAGRLCHKVFYTSRHSYTARMSNAVQMPVGVDTSLYRPAAGVSRTPASILFYARMAPSKRPEVLVHALAELKKQGIEFEASFYGTPLPEDECYVDEVKREALQLLGDQVRFYPGQPHREGPAIFSAHDIFVNLGQSGMYDKTIFEAAACGCLVLAASDDFKTNAGHEFWFDGSAGDLAQQLKTILAATKKRKELLRHALRLFSQKNSLALLSERLLHEVQ